MDDDDWALIVPAPEEREIIETTSSSGDLITDPLLKRFKVKSNQPSGGFFGSKVVGQNFRSLLELHPTHIDPMSSLVGG